ncbi:MAG: DAK2 domain-containing protein [Clostridia bacterium]|nr:DAK2 domain-containing protein [Clostridia bacterium]
MDNITMEMAENENVTNKEDLYLDGHMFAKMAQGGAAQLRSNAEEVNKLNVFPVPDGDTGDNMRMTIESGIAALERVESGNLAEVMQALSHGMLLGARGNSGVILSQLFAGLAKGLTNCDKADAQTIGQAMLIGVKQAYNSVMTPTEGTILTVAREATEYAVANITPESTVRSLFGDLISEMYASLQRTPEILAVLKQAGVIDSGGAGLFYIMDGFNRVLNGEELHVGELAEATASTAEAAPEIDLDAFGPDSEMTYGYCTELLLRLQTKKVDLDTFDESVIRNYLMGVGDSIVTFRVDSIVKIHVHTKTPDEVLAFCRQFGEFLKIKIENMSLQHNETLTEEAPASTPTAALPIEKKQYGIVSVCSGDGIEAVFTELGVDVVVSGGQTQNPSTNDFLDAFAKIPAEHIFVFPNNGNILLAARQAAEIYTDATIHVLESKDLGSGYVAISSMDLNEESVEAILEQANEAMQRAATGVISPSIRDAELDGVQIKNGDFIGFVGKHMYVSNPDMNTAAQGLLSHMIGDETYLLTVFTGKATSQDQAAALEQSLRDNYPEVEAYFIEGGQDVYPYIFIVE